MHHYHYHYYCCDEEEGVDLILILSFVGPLAGVVVAVAVASLDCEGCGDEPRW